MLAFLKNHYFFFGCILVCLGFPLFEITPAFMSIGTVLCSTALLFDGKLIDNLKKLLSPPVLLFILLWVLLLVGGLYSEDKVKWWSICSRKLPLLLLPLGFTSARPLTKKQVWWVFFVFNAIITFFSIASTINYLQNAAAINASMIESKSVPVWPVGNGISHIYFGVLMSFGIISCLFFALKETQTVIFSRDRIVFGVLGILNFIIIHILSARTGLVALYGGLGILAVTTVWQYRRKKIVWLALLALPLLPTVAYLTVPTFKNKIINSVRDVQINRDGGDINHRSFSMRLEAWKTGGGLIAQHPLTGVGPGDMDAKMAAQYVRNNTVLWPENRVMPHNQFIENSVQMGLIYALLLLVVVLWPFIKLKRSNTLQWAIAAMFFFAMCFESVLERQIGVTLFPLVYFLSGYLPKNE
ncbi:MAG: O-antigen ligase family protein [Bacteroidetes bacterium]|nr:MAG: O-antigen ligase family protein [Bacteroidota bacterium]